MRRRGNVRRVGLVWGVMVLWWRLVRQLFNKNSPVRHYLRMGRNLQQKANAAPQSSKTGRRGKEIDADVKIVHQRPLS